MTIAATRARRAATLVVAALGALVAVWLFAAVPVQGEDFDLRLAVGPSLHGGVTLEAPPLGTLSADSFAGPSRIVVEVGDLHPDAAEVAVSDALSGQTPEVLAQDGSSVLLDGIRGGLWRLLVLSVALAALGGAGAAFLLGRTRAAATAGAAMGAFTFAALALLAVATHESEAYQRPASTGAFAALPVAGDPSAPLPTPDVGSTLGKLQRNLVGLYNGFLLPGATVSAREGAAAVVIARSDADRSLLQAVSDATGAQTMVWLDDPPFEEADTIEQEDAEPGAAASAGDEPTPTARPGADADETAAEGELPDVARVIRSRDLPVFVGMERFFSHTTGALLLAGPRDVNLAVQAEPQALDLPRDVPRVSLPAPPGPDVVVIAYLDPVSGTLQAYDLAVQEDSQLAVTRHNLVVP